MVKIDTLLFDLGNVLFPFNWKEAYVRFSEELKRDVSFFKEASSNPDYAILFYEFGTGRISSNRFVKRLNELFNSNMSMETITDIWCSIFSEDREMFSLLKKVVPKYNVFILSDTDIFHWKYLQNRYKLDSIVNGAILSFRRGQMKSDAGAFKKIVDDYKFVTESTIFIDDLEKNIECAKIVGIKGIIHKSVSSTKNELKKNGVEV